MNGKYLWEVQGLSRVVKFSTIPEMVAKSVEKYAHRPALYDPTHETEYSKMTYEEMWNGILTIASCLVKQSIQYGDRVGILSEGRSWWPISDIAIMSLGAWTVPIYPSLPANQAQHIVRHSEMKGIFVENITQLNKLCEASEEGLPDLEWVVVFREEGSLDTQKYPWPVYTYRDWLQAPKQTELVEQRMQSVQRSDIATIVYTSGTTGVPKGVLLSHDNLLSNIEALSGIFDIHASDQTLSYLPLSHIFERTCGQFFILYTGAAIAYSRGFKYITEDFQLMPPTVFSTVPRLLEKVYEKVMQTAKEGPSWKYKLFRHALEVAGKARADYQPVPAWQLKLYDGLVFNKIRTALGGRLRMIVAGGAPMPSYAGRFFLAAGVPVAEGYGMTETSPVIAVNHPHHPMLGTVGRVLENVEVKFLEDGELLVRGPSMTHGYFKDEAATGELFTEDWLHTGDVAEFTEDGYLRITDRKKNLLVLSTGKKVTPAPIEADILKSPYIDQVLLIGQGKKYVSAIVVPAVDAVSDWLQQNGRNLSVKEMESNPILQQFLMEEIARETSEYAKFEQPKKIIVTTEPFSVENGQLTPTLKVRSKVVLQSYENAIDEIYDLDDAPKRVAVAAH